MNDTGRNPRDIAARILRGWSAGVKESFDRLVQDLRADGSTLRRDSEELGRALAGERLGPKDVTACPRLPEVNTVGRQLAVINSAIIVGASGCGKSITAYQSAYDLHQGGWEVLRLVDPRRSPE